MSQQSEAEQANPRHRRIRSYVLREGKLTTGQARALDEHWDSFGIDVDQVGHDLRPAFSDPKAPLVVDIGFGNGESLLYAAARETERNFIGIEVHRPGVGALLIRAAERQLGNLRVINHDAVEVMKHCVPLQSLAEIRVFFPDPWPKKRHHKRRLIQSEFVHLLSERLQVGGVMHLATDWAPYAEQMMAVLSAEPLLRNQRGPGEFAPRPTTRPETKFEQRGQRLGHDSWDLLFERSGDA